MSFRSRVLDALDIKKDHVRIPVYQTFVNPGESIDAVVGEGGDPCVAGTKPYAVSRCIKSQVIGPNNRKERLEVLGFVVGDDPGDAPQLPDCLNRDAGSSTDYSGLHFLGGLYDSTNRKLMKMRKSGITPPEFDSQYQPGLTTTTTSANVVNEHTHTDWPDNATEQALLLNNDPSADALYYHKTQVRFLLTGIDDISKQDSSGDNASNHRGTVRLLVLRPRTPAVRTRVDGTNGEFIINHDYMPNWDTQLFYDRSKQLGGKLDASALPHTISTYDAVAHQQHPDVGTGALSPTNLLKHPDANSLYSSEIVSYGLEYAEKPERTLQTNTQSVHYGHFAPTTIDHTAASTDVKHQLTATDLLMSKINKQKYAVLHDEVFTLDSLHHGAAAQHIANVTIPYNKKVKFAGRVPFTQTSDDGTVSVIDALSPHTLDEPMNMSSRPIILFLSYNQKISASVEGWTAISEC
jgi:hypothetical protein